MTGPRAVGILLAAGAATRFGAPKQLAELDGVPLVAHAVDALLDVPALHTVYVVVGANGDAVAEALHEDVEVVRCPDWEEGMAASLRAGVRAAEADGADVALVHLADLPRITPRVIAMMLDAALGVDGNVHGRPVRATYDGAPGHPVVLPAASFPDVLALRGDAGARALLDDPVTIRVEAGHLADPTDVDTPEILESLRS